MKKVILIVLGFLVIMGCYSGIDDITGGIKVDDRVKVYIDNLSSQDITAVILKDYDNPTTFGGIKITQNTTGSFIEMDFTKNSMEQKGRLYAIDLFVTTSDSAINKYGITNYNKYDDGIYMRNPRPKMIIKDSQSTESAFEVSYETY